MVRARANPYRYGKICPFNQMDRDMKPKIDKLSLEELDEFNELKILIREFLDEISGVPMRAVDCNQNNVDNLWGRIAEIVGWK